jgi:hypothetical protein
VGLVTVAPNCGCPTALQTVVAPLTVQYCFGMRIASTRPVSAIASGSTPATRQSFRSQMSDSSLPGSLLPWALLTPECFVSRLSAPHFGGA